MNAKEVEILLVEDSQNDAELTIRALKKRRLANNICHVKDGEEALNFIFANGDFASRNVSRDRPKIVLLDLKLPKVDGMEVLRRIRADERTKTLPVIIMTSSSEEKDIVEGYKLGVNSYIVKPVEFEKFAEAVEEVGLYWLLLNEPPC